MASAVNNLRVNNKEVRKIFFNGETLKEFYYNGVLVWKNANPFIFTPTEMGDTSQLSTDTIVFVGFKKNETFEGSYTKVEDAKAEKDKMALGQMITVEETTDGEK